MSEIKLTQYSHGAGCGCKISPALLDTILKSSTKQTHFPSLLVGNQSSDDAAVFDLGDGNCIVSTTDFFMPIVDDPFTFGAIASVNAISDVYAMGGKPVMAIAILGWPINTLSAEVAQQVLEGSRSICEKAGIPLAGGHSIDSPEPIFGLAVTGSVRKENLKRNDTAKSGAHIYLTKPLGIGIVTTAQKKGIVEQNDFDKAVNTMLTLNSIGAELGAMNSVCALTDVTGFGLLGHLTEVCRGSGLSATIEFSNVPKFDFLDKYVAQKSMPGGTQRNWDSYGKNISPITEEQKAILADPQTSGGLLICVEENGVVDFENWARGKGLALQSFGKLTTEGKYTVVVNS